MVHLVEMVAELHRHELTAAPETSIAQFIHHQNICPQPVHVVASEGLFQVLAQVIWKMGG